MDFSRIKKILVIKTRLQGDVLLTAPFFFHLKKALPEAKITAMIYKETEDMLSGHPAVSEWILYDKNLRKGSLFKRIREEIKLLLKIRKEKFDLVVNLTEGDRGAIIALVSKAPYRVGFDPGRSGFFGKKKAYTHLVRMCPTPRHTVEKNLDVLRYLGIFPEPCDHDLTLHIPENAKKKVLEFLKGKRIEEKKYLLIHPFASHSFKMTSSKQISDLIRALEVKGEQIILSSGPDPKEKSFLEKIVSLKGGNPPILVSGIFSLKEFAALIFFSKALICVDSVALHIASALKTPVIALFGPTSEKMWGPWKHPKSLVVSEEFSCRPCQMGGCGESKYSECLHSLSYVKILDNLTKII